MDAGQKKPEALDCTVTPLYTIILSRLHTFYPEQGWKLVKYELQNNSEDEMRVFIEFEIKGLSYNRPNDFLLAPKSKNEGYYSPPPDPDKVNTLSQNENKSVYQSFLSYKAEYAFTKDGIIHQCRKDSVDITLLARNVIYWAIPDPQDNNRRISLLDYLVEWVTPNDQSINRTLKDAIDKQSILKLGYQKGQNPNSLVRTIYNELKKEIKLTYRNLSPDIIIPNQGQIHQKVQLPSETLGNGGFANCVDGAVLYASLIEAAGLDAIVVFSAHKVENSNRFDEGHALVGWRKEKGSKQYEFLETTITLNASFDGALKAGNRKYQKLDGDGWFDNEPFGSKSFAYRLPVRETRKKIRSNSEKEEHLPSETPLSETPLSETPPSEQEEHYLGNGNHFAVIVGTNSYRTGDIYDQKQTCPYDAELLYQQLMINSFHPSRLHLLADGTLEPPTSQHILSHLKSIADACAPDDLLLFFYSGVLEQVEQNYYLSTFEPKNTAVSLAQIRQIMMLAPARAKVIILDIYTLEIDTFEHEIEEREKEFMPGLLQQLEDLTVLASYKKRHKELACSLFTKGLLEQFQPISGSDDCITIQHLHDNMSNIEIKLYPLMPYQTKQIIVCRPGQETRSYFLYAYQYLIKRQKSLESVREILNSEDEIVQADIEKIIRILEAIHDYKHPEARPPSTKESRLEGTLHGLSRRIGIFLNRDVASLRKISTPLILQRKSKSICEILQPILLDVIKEANKLRRTIMPGETEISHSL